MVNVGVGYGMDQAHLLKTLESFGFEGLDESSPALLEGWLQGYPESWPAMAVVEAVYQGLYKLVSVEQIIRCWQRRGEPRINFDPTFERQILDKPWQPLVVAFPTLIEVPEPSKALPRLGHRPVVNRLRELIGVA